MSSRKNPFKYYLVAILIIGLIGITLSVFTSLYWRYFNKEKIYSLDELLGQKEEMINKNAQIHAAIVRRIKEPPLIYLVSKDNPKISLPICNFGKNITCRPIDDFSNFESSQSYGACWISEGEGFLNQKNTKIDWDFENNIHWETVITGKLLKSGNYCFNIDRAGMYYTP